MRHAITILCLLLAGQAAQGKVVTYATHSSFDVPGLTKAEEDHELKIHFEGTAEANCGIDLVRVPWGQQRVSIYSAVLSRPDGLVDLGRNDPATYSLWAHSGTRGGRTDHYKRTPGLLGRNVLLHEFGHLLPEYRGNTTNGGHINNKACVMDIRGTATSMCPQEIAVFRKHYGPPKTKPSPTPGTFTFRDGTAAAFGNGTQQGFSGKFDGVNWGLALYDPAASWWYIRFVPGSGKTDRSFQFGAVGKSRQGIVGDWNGDGRWEVGLYDPATGDWFRRNSLTPGPADEVVNFGRGGQALSGGVIGTYTRRP